MTKRKRTGKTPKKSGEGDERISAGKKWKMENLKFCNSYQEVDKKKDSPEGPKKFRNYKDM